MQRRNWIYGWLTQGRTVLWVAVGLLLFATSGQAQIAGTGNIQGTTTDATDAVITNAIVKVTNDATQVRHTAVTDANGRYIFPNLPIGTYTVSITAAGFKRYTKTSIVLEVGSSISIPVTMLVGTVDQTVQVEASALALQTEDASLKQTISKDTMTAMPLNGRQMTSLVTLTGAAVNANAGNDIQGSKTFWSSAVISIAGGQGNATDYRLDGGDHNDYMTNVNLPFPFPDAVAEFSVETAALGAQSGLHPGGLVNVVTRSGSNQWHGSAFEFIRNNYIDATNFFSTSKDMLHQNQFGGAFGGKIVPNRVFGFAGYQRLQSQEAQANSTAYVPTAANLSGDFSADLSTECHSTAVQLLNPQTGDLLTDNQINTSTFDKTALALAKYLPTAANSCGLVTYAMPAKQTENQFVTRIDATLNSANSIYGRYLLDGYEKAAYYSPTNALLTTGSGNRERVQSLTIGETYVISNNLVNSAHATLSRRRDDRGPATKGISPDTFGIDVYSQTPIGMQVSVSNKWSIYCGTCATAYFNVNTMALGDDLNWTHKRHQIVIGGEFVRTQLNINNANQANGNFSFTGIYGQKGPAGTSTSGTGQNANLDFLTGSMNSFSQSRLQQNALRKPVPNFYIQDTYHVSNRIVISAGARWDPEYFQTDYFGRGSTFDYDAFLAGDVSSVYPNAPAGSFYYGDRGVPKAFTKNAQWQFSPRLGLTFDPDGHGKTVIRLGGALVYDEINLFTAQRNQQNPPFGRTVTNTALETPLSFAKPWSTGTVTTNPFPAPVVPTSSTTFPSQAQYIVLPKQFHSPYLFQWTASIQREFGHGWQFDLAYIGNKTSHSIYGAPMNPAVYIPGTCGSSACSTTSNYSSRFALTLANPTYGPMYQGGGSGSNYITYGADATYHGMVASIQHRMSSNFVLISNYTWSHCIDINDNTADFGSTTVQNPSNINGDKGNCGFDFRHVVNTTLVTKSHFAAQGHIGQIVNHWELSPLVHITDGAPFNVSSGEDNSLIDIKNDRPDVADRGKIYTHNKIRSGASSNARYISASAFAQNAAGTFGNSGRNAYRGPKFFQLDAALSRSFPVHNTLAMTLRFEGFNVLNHPNFAAPGSGGYLESNTSLVSSTFGEVTSTVNNYGARIFQGAVKLTF